MPEYIWGYDHVTKRYKEIPEESYKKIIKQIRKNFPKADIEDLKKVI